MSGSGKRQYRMLVLLTRNRLLAQTGINIIRYHKDPRKRRTRIAVLAIVIFCLCVFMVYCAAGAALYGLVGMSAAIPALSMVAAGMTALLFTIFKANGDLYAFRDLDLLLSLPIPVRTIVQSRLLNMVFWNGVIGILVMLPMGLVYVYFADPGPWYGFFFVAGVLLSPLIPTALAAIAGAAITAVSSKSRHAGTFSTLLGFAFVIGLAGAMAAIASFGGDLGIKINPGTGEIDVSGFAVLAGEIVKTLERVYPPAILYGRGAVQGSIPMLLAFATVSLFTFGLAARVLTLRYREINAALTARRNRRKYRIGQQNSNSVLAALIGKSIQKILRSPVCATNLLMGSLFTLLVSLAALIAGPDKLFQITGMGESRELVSNAAPYVLGGLASMTNTACLQLSLEGRSIWILKSMPIPQGRIYLSYWLTNLTFTLPAVLAGAVLLTRILPPSPGLFLIPAAMTAFTAAIGVFIGNRMAYYDWQEESHLVKQSIMSLLGMLGGAALVLVLGVAGNAPGLPLEPGVRGVVIAIAAMAVSAVILLTEMRRPLRASGD